MILLKNYTLNEDIEFKTKEQIQPYLNNLYQSNPNIDVLEWEIEIFENNINITQDYV